MSFNLLTAVQQKLHLQPFSKVNPNTQELPDKKQDSPQQKLIQAVTTAALVAIYEASKSEEGIDMIANQPLHTEWASELFGENKTQVLENISQYSGFDSIHAESKLNEIAGVSIGILRDHVPVSNQREGQMKSLMSTQRDFILPYMPAALQLGTILHDNTIDDRTNKMSGPISSLVNKLQTSFDSPETKEEAVFKQNIHK